jgi:CheY-like chemotaxis protein
MMSTIQELVNLSNQMLSVNWQDGKQRLGSRQAINMNKVVSDIQALMELTAHAKECRLVVKVDNTFPPILTTNGLHLQCLLIYLLNNIIQNSQLHQQIALRITTKNILKDRKIVLRVAIDHSSKQVLKNIDVGMVNKFVKALGGSIEKEALSEQTVIQFTASFTIPLLETIIASLKKSQYYPQKSRPAKYTVLLVEDHLLAQFAAEYTLTSLQSDVTIARTGKEALQKTKQKRFDIIFMDLGLPDGRGMTFSKKIYTQKKGLNVDTPMIAVTAHATAEESNQCKEIGMYTVLHKPLSTASVAKIFKKLSETPDHRHRVDAFEQSKPLEKPVIDLILGAELVDSDIRKAQSMLDIFIYFLTGAQAAIKKAYDAKNVPHLIDEVHKLYGAACYCGVPRLIEALYKLETALKSKKYQNIAPLYQALMQEIQRLIDEYEPSEV